MTHITNLIVSNIKRISAVQIKPDGSLVIIGGENGQGKTSALDAIWYALGGKRALPAKPVKRGAKKGKIVLDLSNGLRATLSLTAAGGSTLTVTDESGEKLGSPQRILDKLCGELTFDPLAYLNMKPGEQASTLRSLAGVDTAKYDHERKQLYDERTQDNREVTRLKTRIEDSPKNEGAPDQEVSIADLTDEMVRLGVIIAENQKLVDEATGRATKVEEAASSLESANAVVEALTKQLEQAEEDRKLTRQHCLDAEKSSEAAAEVVRGLSNPNLDEVNEQIRTAEETNRLVRENAARLELVDELRTKQDDASYLTEQIEAIDAKKAAMLEKAEFPVPGLGFDELGVTLDDVPLEQASGADGLRLSVAMGIALNPELRVLLIRDGSLLDSKSMAMVAKMAEAADVQVWLERVSDGDEGAVIIEDGTVRDASK